MVSLHAVIGDQQTVFQILLACRITDTIDVKMVVSYSCLDKHANSILDRWAEDSRLTLLFLYIIIIIIDTR